MANSLKITKTKLFKLFHAEGTKEFKSNFIQHKNLKMKLKTLKLNQLYTYYQNNIDDNTIRKLRNRPQTGKDIFKTKVV